MKMFMYLIWTVSQAFFVELCKQFLHSFKQFVNIGIINNYGVIYTHNNACSSLIDQISELDSNLKVMRIRHNKF